MSTIGYIIEGDMLVIKTSNLRTIMYEKLLTLFCGLDSRIGLVDWTGSLLKISSLSMQSLIDY